MTPTYEVMLNGQPAKGVVVAFDADAGWIDCYETDDNDAIVIVDGMPVIVRKTGDVTLKWDMGAPADAA